MDEVKLQVGNEVSLNGHENDRERKVVGKQRLGRHVT